jgi:hypothetical protein
LTQLVRFGTAGQVYRVGELIFPNQSRLKTKVPPPIPVGWDFGMRVGLHSSGNVGYRDPAHGPGHGAFNPLTFMGLPVSGLISVNTGSCFVWLGASVQAPGISTITVTVQGLAAPLVCAWSNATPGTVSARYQASIPSTIVFRDHLLANLGKVLGVTLVGAAVEDEEPNPEPGVVHWDPPYPWASIATHALLNAWVDIRDLTVPSDWFDLTLAQKRAYLEMAYG